MMRNIKAGIYQHYKGPFYLVYEVAEHSETEEPLVVYRPLYGEFQLYVRPLDMFGESVVLADGLSKLRFGFVAEVPLEHLRDKEAAMSLVANGALNQYKNNNKEQGNKA